MVARSHLRRSVVAIVLLCCLVSPLTVTVADAGSRYRFKYNERCFMRKINRARARHGLPALKRDKQLGYVARVHAREMAGQGAVWDDYYLGRRITHWSSLGGNAGGGGTCRQLSRAFLNSWPHRVNILGPFHFVGVGVSWSSGNMFVEENFESHLNPGNIYRWP
ncbi:MAG: CAP domain-containing protein [Actinomycetota bacterium]|nr:CAP domain-containing protein [Actinomycetota bacterium]